MARSGPLLTEAQWKKITPLLPKPLKHRKGGRPWIENRRVLEGILWILRSGARWQDLPETVEAARDRTDLPAQEESRSARHARRSRVAALSAALDRRAHSRLARKLPSPG